MLTKEIRKPKTNFFQKIGNAFKEVQQQPSSFPVSVIQSPPQVSGLYLSKVEFIKFVESAKEQFSMGDLVTLKMWPVLAERADPPPWYSVSDFQELQSYASFDQTHRQYRVVGLRPGDNIREGLFQFAAPAAIRPLTDQEKFLVNLRHQEKLDKKREEKAQGESNNEGYTG